MIKKVVLTLGLILFLLSNALGEEEKEGLRLEDID